MNIELSPGKAKEAMRDAGASSRDLYQVPIGELHIIEGFNVRTNGTEYREHIEGLAKSITENGFYQHKPLAGYVAVIDGKQTVCITDGHCRFQAAQEAIKQGAEIKSLPVVVSPKGTTMEDLTVALVTSNSGKPLTPYETGLVCKRLISFGWEEKEIAKRLGVAAQRVGDLLTLVAAPKSVRSLVMAGTVSASQAIDTIKKHGDKAPEKLAAGAEKAAASGKRKATRKHIDEKPTYQAVVRAFLEWEKVSIEPIDDWLKKIVEMAKEASA